MFGERLQSFRNALARIRSRADRRETSRAFPGSKNGALIRA
jgi:hypothetical protein